MKKKVAIVIIMVITIVLITIIGLFVLNRNKDENSKNDFENVDSNQFVKCQLWEIFILQVAK